MKQELPPLFRDRVAFLFGAMLLMICFVPVATAQESRSANQLTEEQKNRKVEPPRISDEDKVKLWIDGVPWFKSIEEQGRVRDESEDPNEHAAYCYTLIHAHKVPPDLLTKHAIRDVPFANLIEERTRKLYRFEPVHFEGRLVMINRIPKVPQKVRDSLPELKEMYEGWLFPKDDPNQQPICILFTSLPEGMEAKGRCDHWVQFEGYYFKIHVYRSEETNAEGEKQLRRTPLLIGRSPRYAEPPPSVGFTFGNTLVPAIIGMILLIGGVAFGLTFWFRKGDREVRQHLEAPKQNPFANPGDTFPPRSGWEDQETNDRL